MRALRLLALLALASTAPASAEDLVSGLSQDQIEITSNYTGTDLVVFGAIENATSQDFSGRDVVVVVRGPNTGITVRKKAHVAGVWINSNRIVLNGMPSYYYVASSRPLSSVAPLDTLARYGIGLKAVEPQTESTPIQGKAEPYVEAVRRQKARDRLYGEAPNGVEFLSPTLFRVRVPVPATVQPGQYRAEVYLFRDSTVVSAQSTPLFIGQAGLERRLFDSAHKSPLTYGLATVFMALLLGWLSSFLVRRTA
ncbi:MAG TPA: TIGR02186 family protein [Rhizomicrobium sp.]|jgi:uncharacterized protein (TIGR02186 family)|nr:TIGR02186 family protein [Rhizomicrobium sp.]